MLARHLDAGFRTVMLEHRVIMLDDYPVLLVQIGIGQRLAGAQRVHHLAEQPGLAIGTAPDHHAIGAGALEQNFRIFFANDIAVSDHRNPRFPRAVCSRSRFFFLSPPRNRTR
jgi:hypothetical protein